MLGKDKTDIKFAKLSFDELYRELNTSYDGLSIKEANHRLNLQGENIVDKGKKKSAWLVLISQFKNWLMVALLIAAVIAYALGQHLEVGVIFSLVMLSVILGFFQEYRAEMALEKLAEYISRKSRVKRDGKWIEVDSEKLVVGDLVEIRIGDIVPADLRLIELDGLSVNESTLTGESMPVSKTVDKIRGAEPQHPKNMAFMGTSVAEGIGKGIVVSTGSATLLGKTASILARQPQETEFQKQTKKFSKFLFKVIVLMTAFVFIVNTALDKGVLDSFLFALALAIGITPELLPAIMTITLSQGSLKIAKKKVIVKRLMSVEDLGNIDTLCTDKTGTLTKGEFSLVGYESLDGGQDQILVLKALLCTSGELVGEQILTTNPIDKALWMSKEAKSIKHQLKSFQLIDENEFDFSRRRMSVLVKADNITTLIVKGSVESMVSIAKASEDQKEMILSKTKNLENQGYRVIGIGEKLLEKTTSEVNDEENITFLGFLLFSDPIKTTALKSLEKLRRLGVNIKILSGDSETVTAYIARQAGFDGENEKIVSGEELLGLSIEEFEKRVANTTLFARVTPEQKYKIVESLNKEGHVVGFLGDGVNDAPALRAADVGIAVDSGAMVAKEAADIILLRKDLMVLADGIEAGRKTFGNIMKYILNTISANYGNMFTVSLSSLFLKFIPLLPSQILLNNFISDIPLFAVATDNVDADFVKKPKKWNIGTISRFMLYFGLISSIFDFLMILPMVFIWHVSTDVFRTAWFIESSLSEILVTFAIRTKLPFYKSIPSFLLIGFSLFSSLVVIGMPLTVLGETLFEFSIMPLSLWIWVGIVVVGYFVAVELSKRRFFKRFEL